MNSLASSIISKELQNGQKIESLLGFENLKSEKFGFATQN